MTWSWTRVSCRQLIRGDTTNNIVGQSGIYNVDLAQSHAKLYINIQQLRQYYYGENIFDFEIECCYIFQLNRLTDTY